MALIASPHLASLEQSLKDSLQKEAAESERRQKAVELQKQTWERNRQVLSVPEHLSNGVAGRDIKKEDAVEEASILNSAQAREQAIEKRKLQVKEKVQLQLNRVTDEARKLDELRRELDSLEDPTKKEVAEIRKRIEAVDRELKPLQNLCSRKERELKEAVEAHNEKARLKTDLVGKLMEIVTQSEKVRSQKLDELSKLLEAMEKNAVRRG